jgi:hypothetical protein
MSRRGSTGVLSLHFVPTIVSKAAPSVAEITAGVDLTGFLVRDGLATPFQGSTIPAATMADRYNATAPGSYGGQPITATFHRDDVTASDLAWTTLVEGTAGFLVVRRFGGATKSSTDAVVAAQRVEVWPISVISREMLPTADNELQRFQVSCAVPTPPARDAVVAA